MEQLLAQQLQSYQRQGRTLLILVAVSVSLCPTAQAAGLMCTAQATPNLSGALALLLTYAKHLP
jgi:hypothetical protein